MKVNEFIAPQVIYLKIINTMAAANLSRLLAYDSVCLRMYAYAYVSRMLAYVSRIVCT